MSDHSYAKAGWRIMDVFGQEVKPGDIVAYPVRRSSSVWLAWAKVAEVFTRDKRPALKCNKADGRQVILTNLDNIVKAPDGWAQRE